MATVVVVKADSYDQQVVELAMKELFDELGGISKFIKPNTKVLIKPNMLEGLKKELSVTTHPEVVRAVIREVKKAGGLPSVGDSPAMGNTVKTAQQTGILQVCLDEGVPLVPFQEAAEFPFEAGRTVKKFTLAKELADTDKVISLAKMKTHSFTGVTGGIKNLFGFVVGTEKAQFHLRMQRRSDFAAMLLDLAAVVKPVLYIVDGITAMEGAGPRNGTPLHAGVIIAGENGFAVDMVMTDMMGFDPESLPVAAKALKAGLVPPFSSLVVCGSARSLKMRFKAPRNLEALEDRIPKWAADFGQRQLTAKPVIQDVCTGCGRCADHCPPKAMTMVGRKMTINNGACIRCYCCQEVCPHDAVSLEEGLLLKTVKRLTGK